MDCTKREGSRLDDIHVLCTYPQKADFHFPQILTLKMSANGVSKQLFVRKQWFLVETTHIALEQAFTSTTAATDKPQCVRRLEFIASLPPSSSNLPEKKKEQRDKKQQKSRERSQAKRRPYPTSSRYMRLMSTSPRRFRKYTADAATGILPCSSCCCCCCYSRVPPRSPPDLAAARRSLSLFLFSLPARSLGLSTALPRLPFPACARRVSHPAVMSVCFSFAGGGFQLRQNFDMKNYLKKKKTIMIGFFSFFISKFWRSFFLSSSKISRIYNRKINFFANSIFPISLSKNGEISPE